MSALKCESPSDTPGGGARLCGWRDDLDLGAEVLDLSDESADLVFGAASADQPIGAEVEVGGVLAVDNLRHRGDAACSYSVSSSPSQLRSWGSVDHHSSAKVGGINDHSTQR